ncbi:MAG: DNA gyrase subunit B [Clostridia bacterium]|nr:DNA gyrase subunit B [Clostridia bacterium]
MLALREYTADDIKLMEGLEAVRVRPGMYIGSTGARGLHHMLWEIVDNSVDEVANGYADTVSVTINKDNSISVEDNGRGIPVGTHAKTGLSAVEVVFTKLHAGGKFGNESYAYSGGLHGVGASVVNALSRYLIVEVFTSGRAYEQRFHSYEGADGKIISGAPEGPLAEVGRTRRKGTRITFLPDDRVFETISLSFDIVSNRMRELAYLNRGARFLLEDKRDRGGKSREFMYSGGICDFVKELNADKKPLYPEPIFLSGMKDGIYVEAALQHNDGYSDSLFSYVNNIPTTEGGTHETGFKTAFTRVMNEYCRRTGVLKPKDVSLAGEDFREGMIAVLSLRMQNVQFEGQTKTHLGNTEAKTVVEALIGERLTSFLEDLKNASLGAIMADKAVKAAKAKEAARKAKTMAREKSKLENAPLVGKLASCTGRNPDENELFIVEGDSAGGSAKQGRDRRFQAILPLRGKLPNVEKKRLEDVLQNEEYRSIITAIGTGIGSDFTMAGRKFDKVIILSDADQDGAHIRALLLTFFYRYMKQLIIDGHVYMGMPPLYKIQRGNEVQYAYSDAELARLTRGMKNYTLQRYKGLGEMNPLQLWDTTMNPEHRTLVQVTIEDAANVERMVSVLMGDDVAPRRAYISEHADFNKADSFEDKARVDGDIDD